MTDQFRLERVDVEQVLVLRLTGAVDDASVLAEAVGSLHAGAAAVSSSARLVLDVRPLETLSAAGARKLIRFAAERGPRVCLLVDENNAAVRALSLADSAGVVPKFTDPAAILGPTPPAPPVEPAETGAAWLAEVESLTRTLVGDTTIADALRHIVEAAQRVIEGADLVSITLLDPDGVFHTPAGTDPVAAEFDQVQYRSGDGPCVSAALPEGPGYAVSEDLRTEVRWPSLVAAATSHGFRAIISTALQPGEGATGIFGALNVYSCRPHGLTAADRHTALLLATHASLALAHVQRAELAGLERAHLRRAISSRDVIGQAKGILMNRQAITAEEAFTLLRQTSQRLNIKVVELARTLASRHTDLDAPR